MSLSSLFKSRLIGTTLAAFAILLAALGFSVSIDTATTRLAESGITAEFLPQGIPDGFVGERALEALLVRITQRPQDAAAYRDLGITYLQKARETADPSYYIRADAALNKAIELSPKDSDVMVALGTLALARHQFAEALDWGEKAEVLRPHKASAYGVLGDALVELGRYDEAFDAIQRMVDLRPDLTSYARVSYARELMGDIQGAIVAMRAATEAAGPVKEGGAWTRVYLAHLLWTYQGDLNGAEQEYRLALFNKPDYAPALAGLALVSAAGGQLEEALTQMQRAAILLPLPEHVIMLGDLLRAAGRQEEAKQQDALVRAMDHLARAAGIDTEIEIALFEADLGEYPAAAVEAAQRGYQRRPGVKAADTLAWALFKAGQIEEARAFMAKALSVGSLDPLMHYHAAKIAFAAGDNEAAVRHLRMAVTSNAHFSLRYADDARQTFETLNEGGQP